MRIERENKKIEIEIEALKAAHVKDVYENINVKENCKDCGFVSNSKTDLVNHKETMHSNLSNFRFDFTKPSSQHKSTGGN